ncbi:DUF5625 family protein [Herbaspirillum sp. DW155]|uniref:DUF5625 family protein n=1 Tax=Herbaspirillum sp. DW155 TaxID=3095609 RepID=UPI003084CC23|nr:DUF5625 family protein [Herbaspirillum sp. DW155]
MMVKKKLRKLMVLIGMASAVPIPSVQATDLPVSGKVHESGFHMPFPVQKGGETIDILVKVEKTKRAYGFYLILVEDLSWSMDKKEDLRRVHRGWVFGDEGTLAYPFKVRLRIDPVEKSNQKSFDLIITERSPAFSQSSNLSKEIWRAQKLHFGVLQEGTYRVRLENLAAAPQIDFSTLFAFEKDTRKF